MSQRMAAIAIRCGHRSLVSSLEESVQTSRKQE